MEPSFVHRDEIVDGLALIFGKTKESVRISDPEIREMLSLIPITPDGITLLRGIMGIGKGRFTYAFTKVFYRDTDIGLLQCDPNKTQQESLYGTDVKTVTTYAYDSAGNIGSTEQSFDFDPHSYKFVTSPVKHGNEINRSSKSLQDTLLRLFEEGELEYQSHIFESARPFVTIFDENPIHLQNEGRILEPALTDRIDIGIPMPNPRLFTSLHVQIAKNETRGQIGDTLPNFLTYTDMKKVYEDVQKVEVVPGILFWITCMSQIFFSCKYRKDIANEMFMNTIDCKSCEFDNGICSKIKYPIGQRHIESTIKFAKSRAWLDGRSTITAEDIKAILPFTLCHRLVLTEDTLSNFEDVYLWIKTQAIPLIDKQSEMYQKLMDLYGRVVNSNDKEAFDTISRSVRTNLIHLQVFEELLRIMNVKSDQDLDLITETLSDTISRESLEELEREIDNCATFAVPEKDMKIILSIVEEVTKSQQARTNFDVIMDNKKTIQKLLENAQQMYDRKIVVPHDVFADTVYPSLVEVCQNNAEIDDLQRSLTEDTAVETGSVSINIERSDDDVVVMISTAYTGEMERIMSILEDIVIKNPKV